MTEKSDLEILFPGVEVVVGGESILIKPFTTGQLLRSSKLLAQLAPLAKKHTDEDGKLDMVLLMTEAGGLVIELISIAAKRSVAWVEETAPDEAMDLAFAIVEQNQEYFAKKLGPRLEVKMGPAAAAMGASSSFSPS